MLHAGDLEPGRLGPSGFDLHQPIDGFEVALLDLRPDRLGRYVEARETELTFPFEVSDCSVSRAFEHGRDVVVGGRDSHLQVGGDVPNRPAGEPQLRRLLAPFLDCEFGGELLRAALPSSPLGTFGPHSVRLPLGCDPLRISASNVTP